MTWGKPFAAAISVGGAARFKYNLALLLPSLAMTAPRRIIPLASITGGVFILTSPYVLLDYPTFLRDLLFQAEIMRKGRWFDYGLADIFGTSIGWVHHARFSLPYGFGLFPLLLALLGLAVGWRQRAARPIALFALLFYVVIGAWWSVFARYTLPLLPALAVLAGLGADWVRQKLPPRAHLFAGAVVGVALLVEGVVPNARMDQLFTQVDSRRLLQERLDKEAPGEPIAITDVPPWALPDFRGRKMYRLQPEEFGARHGWDRDGFAARDARLIVILEHPLAYTRNDPALLAWLREHAVEVLTIEAHHQPTIHAFDPQDAFFVPLARFDRVIRPGPNVTTYRLKEG